MVDVGSRPVCLALARSLAPLWFAAAALAAGCAGGFHGGGPAYVGQHPTRRDGGGQAGGPTGGGCPCDTTYGCDGCYCEPPSECAGGGDGCPCDTTYGCDGCYCEPASECY